MTAKHLLLSLLFLFNFLLCFGQKNSTRPSVEGPMGVHVNTHSGSFFYQRSDLYIPSRGLDLDFSFSYNSQRRDEDYGFGPGWTFAYNMSYYTDTLGIVVVQMDGRRDQFKAETDGSYSPTTGLFYQLEEYQPGKYKMTAKDGMTYFFDDASHQRLTKLEDRYHNTITITYTNALPQIIRGPAGREILLTWSDGRLQQMTFEGITPARTFTYEHDETGNPTKVINPQGHSIDYEYDNENRLNTIVDENGNPLNIIYGNSDEVLELVSCLSSQTFTYNAINRKTYVAEKGASGMQITIYAFDEIGRLIQQKGNCCGNDRTFKYDEYNNIIEETDGNGNVTLFVYDDNGNLVKETDALGFSEEYTYEPIYNQPLSFKDKNGHVRTYQYDSNGNLLQVNYPLGISKSYTYDAFGNRVSYTSGNGHTTTYTRNSHGYVTQITNALNGISSFTYDAIGNVKTETDENGNLTSYEYDELDQLLLLTDALGNTEEYAYDNIGNITQIKDKNDQITLLTYDALNRLILVEDALGQFLQYKYDGKGNILETTDAKGQSIYYQYDHLNRLTALTNAINETTSFDYDKNSNPTHIYLPNGNTLNYTYDALNRRIATVDNLGAVEQFEYDKNNNLIAKTNANGNTVRYTYDALNREIEVEDPLGETLSYQWDNNNNLLSQTDRNGKVSSFTYDALNQKLTHTDPLNYTSSYTYDAFGNLVGISDQKNQNTLYEHDALHRLITETFADGASTNYTYNPVGKILSRTDNNGDATTYVYDNIYRLLERQYPDNTKDEFTYDAANNLITAINQHASLQFTYDAINRMTSETLNGKITGFEYNTAERTQTIFYPNGNQIIEKYNPRRQLEGVEDAVLAMDIATFEYDAGQRLTRKNYGNNTFSQYSYDANDRLLQISHMLDNFVGFKYAYDKEGNRTQEEKIDRPTASHQFIYDDLYRLTQSKKGTLVSNNIPNPTSEKSFNYDGLGNRISVADNGNNRNYTTNEVNEYTQITGGTNANLSYDANGNLLNIGNFQLAYNYDNRLTSVDNGTTATYQYDALKRRIKKTTATETVCYYYSGQRVIEERDEQETILATYIYGAGIDEVIAMKKNSDMYFYHENGLGSITHLTNLQGQIVEQYEYDAYGKVSFYDGTYTAMVGSALGNPYLFTGRRLDSETGLYYYRARHYSAELGRFLQRDPLGYVDGLSRYEYALSNPLKFVDPYGFTAIASTIGGVAGGYLGGFIFGGIGGFLGSPAGAVVGAMIGRKLGQVLGQVLGQAAGAALANAIASSQKVEEKKEEESEEKEEEKKDCKKKKRRFSKADRDQGFEDSKDEDGKPRCDYCDTELDPESGSPNSYEADHTNPYNNGGESTKENLTASCRTCNRSKGSKILGLEWIPPKLRWW